MKKISMQSLIIGVGLGIIITSIFNIVWIQLESVYLIDKGSTVQQISNADIIITEDIKYNNSKLINLENDNNKNNLDLSKNVHNNNSKQFNEIFISKGMQSEEIAHLLETKGIIESEEEFINLATKLKITKKLQYGWMTIPINSSLDEILLILTKK